MFGLCRKKLVKLIDSTEGILCIMNSLVKVIKVNNNPSIITYNFLSTSQ